MSTMVSDTQMAVPSNSALFKVFMKIFLAFLS